MEDSDLQDVLIVGAGPAGATAAIYAARAGLKTLLVDRSVFPRDKVCGDALSGKSVSVLAELGLLEAVRRLPGAGIRRILFGSPGQAAASIGLASFEFTDRLTQRTVPMEGFVIRRRDFDDLLFREARAAGAACVEGFTVRQLLREDGRVAGVLGVDAAGRTRRCRARIVLGCDGATSVVARQAGVDLREPEHLIVAVRGYWRGVAGLGDQIELHFVDVALPGYLWIFPLGQGVANVGLGIVASERKRRRLHLRTTLSGILERPPFADRFRTAEPIDEPVGWGLPVGSRHRPCHGDGFLLLGDAAGLIDPFTGEGIGTALASARIAVEVVQEALGRGDTGAASLSDYDRRLWAHCGGELHTSARLQRLCRHRWLLNLVIGKAARSPRVAATLAGMMANTVPRKDLASPLFYLRLLFS